MSHAKNKVKWCYEKAAYQKDHFIHAWFDDAAQLTRVGWEGLFENIWYAKLNNEWKELGRVRFAVYEKK